ncbi:ABC transporter permease [Gulosibacter molinativorax]|uniref:ABC transporter permease n=1 Tax=Gulosibacter molinativorax TaxID=256821 RepID=A0ABT7C845_9MICO|nr:ABC transporter permease [Gulosibacter molinativorax]MDJ1371363.1 ABC transporter permease [Gulosibacter molinativorax]QUY62860.1 Putative Na+ efflux ABC transporter, permease component [Gulosibacter molinativorax]
MSEREKPQSPAKAQTLAQPLSRAQGIRLIAKREVDTTLRSKAFVWSFVIVLVVVAIGILAQGFIGKFMESMVVGGDEVVVASTVDVEQLGVLGADSNIVFTGADSATAAVDAVRNGDAQVALVSGAEAATLELYGNDGAALDQSLDGGTLALQPMVLIGETSVPTSVDSLLTYSPVQGFLQQDAAQDFMFLFLMSTAFALVYFMAIMMFSQRIAQTVIEEKASRIVELLLSTVKPTTVLAGKIIGGTILAVGQVASIVIVALVCFAISGQTNLLDLLGAPLIWFVVLFVIGFVLFASLYAALAATVSRPEDVASVTSPLSMLVMLPYFLIVFANQNEAVMTWLSYIPFSSPVAMPIRMFNTGVAWWEPYVALAILVATVLAALWLAGRIYENSILRTGPKVKLKDALKAS